MLRRLSRPSAIVPAVGLWLLGAQAVSASLALIFVPFAAIPGATVEAHTGGESALTDVRGPATLPVYLAPIDIADRISTSKDQRLIPLGNLSVDSHANGHIVFVVPNLPYGNYLSFVYCEPCATHSAGRSLLPTGPFRVGPAPIAESPQPGVAESAGAIGFHILALVGSVAVLLVGALWLRRRFTRRSR